MLGAAVFIPTSPTDGVGDGKLLKFLECSIKGRHYRGWRSRGFSHNDCRPAYRAFFILRG